ncbi:MULTISPECIES: SGNH/GDSL hydrolase family protein [Actinokineospora]|uniref:Lipase 1 n=1 Tax=Actinokineospora fastidiosa TaxID=1816 RepID=A0A918GAM7_9PSEU|nr:MULTISPECIES: SGNH/GDSL hydrolase family protein [Actinokineospora]UVS81655.1 Lipase 1 precursor [Actinokineospora sp. UTMC 2448]GGS26169.1 lipase 1 [Actinokineospora fastidiosa]
MRVPRFLAAALLAVGSLIALAVPAQAAPGKYVALGDSYSSGLGAGSYTNSACRRSAYAYPQLWANALRPSAFSFAACSGAETSNVLSSQISAVTSDTALVTVSIGGNDAGFADVMTDCNLGSDSYCESRNREAQEFARTTLPGRLDAVYKAIRDRAPSARVIVVGYPRIYHLNGTCSLGLSERKRTAINQSSDVLHQVISGRASAHGFTFLNGQTAFAGHEICASGTRWINSVVWPIEESYHPNRAGQNGGYYASLRAITG